MITPRHRGPGDRGSGLVAGLTLIFALTFTGVVWLARDVDRSISNRSTANSIAFQAARSGAQATRIVDVRQGRDPVVDAARARTAAAQTAETLFAGYDVTGSVAITVEVDEVTAVVTITDAGRSVTGIATVEARRAP